ncbi:S1 family peptidase [Micromonospora sp. bgisy143]|uniref:S1 family peptidase n=1 Tax=Micromonospora sp. bgisy143 TaxID=3413790 RepID=UPI003EBE6137
MSKKRGTVVLAATLMATTAMWSSPAAADQPKLTNQQIAAMSPAEQDLLLQPLREIADAAAAVGAASHSGVFSGLELDGTTGTVKIYLTDLGAAKSFLAAVRKTDPTIEANRIELKQGGHTFAELKSAGERLINEQQRSDLSIESVAVPADGTGLTVRARDVVRAAEALTPSAVARRPVAELVGIPTVVEPASAMADASRRRDTPQWISGAALSASSTTQSEGYDCSSGLPARRKSDGRSFLITAGHCFANSVTIYTGWESGGRNKIGVTTTRSDYYDAVAIDTSSTGTTASRTWDGKSGNYTVNDVTGSALSYTGDWVCQTGYTSGVVCGIQVTSGWLTWVGSNGITHGGVEAFQRDGTTACRPGDSGGLVFNVSANVRQARGIISQCGGTKARWTEAPAIFNILGMSLAP